MDQSGLLTKPQGKTKATDMAVKAIDGAAKDPGKKVVTESTIKTVTMTDGRIVDFPGKRKLQKESFEGADGVLKVRLDYVNGETRTFTLGKDMVAKFALHGAEQKLGDEMAGIEDLDDAIVAVDDLVDRLNAGEWTQKRDTSGMAGASILIRALVEYTGKSVEKIKDYLKPKTAADKQALRTSTRQDAKGVTLAAIVSRMEQEKAAKAKKVDTSVMLDELDKI